MLTHILALATVTAFVAGCYILSEPHMKRGFILPSMDEPDDDLIRKCISDSFKMTELINESTTSAELESYYWEIEQLDDSYRGLVPSALLRQHTDRLYDAISIRRDQLNALRAVS